MTLGGESTGGDLVVARSPLVASLLVASLPGGEVAINHRWRRLSATAQIVGGPGQKALARYSEWNTS